MCILLLDYHKDHLTLDSIREEVLDRPTLPLHRWDEGFWAGRDRLAGGTWLGVNESGRWAALTNLPGEPKSTSRGQLVKDFLMHQWDVPPHLERFSGCNLLLGTPQTIRLYSSAAPAQELSYGKIALGNLPPRQPSTRLTQALQGQALTELALTNIPGYGLRSRTLLEIRHSSLQVQEWTYPSGDRIQANLRWRG